MKSPAVFAVEGLQYQHSEPAPLNCWMFKRCTKGDLEHTSSYPFSVRSRIISCSTDFHFHSFSIFFLAVMDGAFSGVWCFCARSLIYFWEHKLEGKRPLCLVLFVGILSDNLFFVFQKLDVCVLFHITFSKLKVNPETTIWFSSSHHGRGRKHPPKSTSDTNVVQKSMCSTQKSNSHVFS